MVLTVDSRSAAASEGLAGTPSLSANRKADMPLAAAQLATGGGQPPALTAAAAPSSAYWTSPGPGGGTLNYMADVPTWPTVPAAAGAGGGRADESGAAQGEAVGSKAHVTELRRQSSGAFSVADAWELSAVVECAEAMGMARPPRAKTRSDKATPAPAPAADAALGQ